MREKMKTVLNYMDADRQCQAKMKIIFNFILAFMQIISEGR